MTNSAFLRQLSLSAILAMLAGARWAVAQETIESPAKAPATVQWNAAEAREHPWILSTARHISQGGVSLLDEKWDADARVLSGKSAVAVGDPYVLTVHLPKGFRLESADVEGEQIELANEKETATVRIVPLATKTVEWKMSFAE